MTNKNIKRFSKRGTVDDMGKMVKLWPSVEANLKNIMALQGYVPILDIVPYRGTKYNVQEKVFHYELVIQGTYVGKRKAEQLEGLLSGLEIRRSTHPAKSKASSTSAE